MLKMEKPYSTMNKAITGFILWSTVSSIVLSYFCILSTIRLAYLFFRRLFHCLIGITIRKYLRYEAYYFQELWCSSVWTIILYWAGADPSTKGSSIWALGNLNSQEGSHQRRKVCYITAGFISPKINSAQHLWKFALTCEISWLTTGQWLIANQHWQNLAAPTTCHRSHSFMPFIPVIPMKHITYVLSVFVIVIFRAFPGYQYLPFLIAWTGYGHSVLLILLYSWVPSSSLCCLSLNSVPFTDKQQTLRSTSWDWRQFSMWSHSGATEAGIFTSPIAKQQL